MPLIATSETFDREALVAGMRSLSPAEAVTVVEDVMVVGALQQHPEVIEVVVKHRVTATEVVAAVGMQFTIDVLRQLEAAGVREREAGEQ